MFGYGLGAQRKTEEEAGKQRGAHGPADAEDAADNRIDWKGDCFSEIQPDDQAGEDHKRKQGRYHFFKPKLQRQCAVGAGIGGSMENGKSQKA